MPRLPQTALLILRLPSLFFSVSLTLFLSLSVSLLAVGCGTAPPPLPAVEPAPGPPARDPKLEPPPFDGGAPVTSEVRQDAEQQRRLAIFDAVWRTVRDKHYDPTLGGRDWNAVRQRYQPLALGAPNEAAFYRTLNLMLGELGDSHMTVTGPGAEDDSADSPESPPSTSPTLAGRASTMGAPPATPASTSASTPAAASPAPTPAAAAPTPPAAVSGIGDPGLLVRVIDGRPTIARVRRGSPAERAGLAPGFLVTAIAGRPLGSPPRSARPLRPVEERFATRQAALRRLQGPTGTKVTVDYLDEDDRPRKVVLDREAARGTAVQIGHLPPLYPEVRVTEVDGVGVIAFNLFLLQPVLPEIQRAMDRFRARTDRPIRALILDLRGNPGGIGAMAIPVAAELVATRTVLGTLQFRDFSQTFAAEPAAGRTPFRGPVAILTDEGTASTSEILAAGLQEAGRARIIGDATLGAALPSVVEALPGGAVMQYVVADFKTPRGTRLDGRGIQPDERVLETRAALRAGRDPVLDAALVALRAGPSNRTKPRALPAAASRPPDVPAATRSQTPPSSGAKP